MALPTHAREEAHDRPEILFLGDHETRLIEDLSGTLAANDILTRQLAIVSVLASLYRIEMRRLREIRDALVESHD
jgi:hypothetical protein